MRNDDDTQTINPEHEAICARYRDAAEAGDHSTFGGKFRTLTDAKTYTGQIGDQLVIVDIKPDGSHQGLLLPV